MSLFLCRGCAAKDAEIARLWSLLQAFTVREGVAVPALKDGAPVVVPEFTPVPLDPAIEVFLDAKFVHGTTLWRQQRREAAKLAAERVEPEKIMETLARGQKADF